MGNANMAKNYEKEARKIYNQVAMRYHKARTKKETRGWLYNEYLEMPATLSLIENARGKKILEVGCGTGLYARRLLKKGAKVYGIDISEAMLEIARKEVKKAEFKLASVEKIPYKSGSFDIVLAPLMLGYLPKWGKAFKEISRVLKPKGVFIFSVDNPIFSVRKKIRVKGKKYYVFGDYFREGKKYNIWYKRALIVKVPLYPRTYETIINDILMNGFEITGYKDSKPLPQSKKFWPNEYKKLMKMSVFCVFRCKKR
jgi:ubiquinone/menaquinone biosynthesis C-methylase UbiE